MKSLKLKKGTAKVLNAFFSNIVQNLDIQQYNVDDPICENINDPHKDIFACLFSIYNTISLSCHEQVCLSGLRFERYFSHHRAT